MGFKKPFLIDGKKRREQSKKRAFHFKKYQESAKADFAEYKRLGYYADQS